MFKSYLIDEKIVCMCEHVTAEVFLKFKVLLEKNNRSWIIWLRGLVLQYGCNWTEPMLGEKMSYLSHMYFFSGVEESKGVYKQKYNEQSQNSGFHSSDFLHIMDNDIYFFTFCLSESGVPVIFYQKNVSFCFSVPSVCKIFWFNQTCCKNWKKTPEYK